jgi:16S rRNA (cytosine967-C5)-methyltransferase
MTPAARIQAVIDILEGMTASALPADRFIREFFRARRYAGSKDRASVADRVFEIARHRASLAWRMQDETPRALAIASLLAEGTDIAGIEALFGGAGYGPPPLTEQERATIATQPRPNPPLYVQGEFPPFLESELTRALGDDLLEEMRATQTRAPVDLRVNTLKASRDQVLATLQAEGFAANPTRYSPFAIRLLSGERLAALRQNKMFELGFFEFQDEAAQMAALLAHARPGERILDLAAGAGGKALALAADMKNRGTLIACDIDAGRLAQLGPRAERAGAVIEVHPGDAPQGPFDAVFVDAPCSGTGTWRRQPELRWRITQSRLDSLMAIQDTLLDEAAARTAPGRRIVYATCSWLACENEDRIAAFLARHPDFAVRPAARIWRDIVPGDPPPGMGEFFRATSHATGTDGFFAAVLGRSAGA